MILERAIRGEVAVVGLGLSGAAATRLLRQAGIRVYASDAGRTPALEARRAELSGLGADVELGGHDLDRIANAAVCIVSPGIAVTARPIAAAYQAGVPVYSEAALGLEAMPGVKYIAVTGTNGKSTTTALVGHLMGQAGFRALAAGNLGLPLCDIAVETIKPEWLAIELSSFQLHHLPNLHPAVGVLTNLQPDHLDRYESLAEYYGDKARLFGNADLESIWVVNGDDETAEGLVAGVPGTTRRFSIQKEADAWFDRDRRMLRLGGEDLLERADLSLLGDHNVANVLAAALGVRCIGVEVPLLAEGLRTFRGLSHRLEPVAEVDGVLWINDSKATNLASTEVAVAALSRPFVLLLGGRHKGTPYTALGPLLRERCRGVVAYGEAQPIIAKDLADSGVPVVLAGSFEEVVSRAGELARPGDAVLLSPACSSYDMFTNYEERGARFRELVESR
ncbi:MAG: UDP-N-acetylmuramoyl-L-alanine--D-glutamate ligase [Gemmatimonadales bacterium]